MVQHAKTIITSRSKIIVIGGYGHVGRKICTQLATYFPENVYAAGRNSQKANAFCSSFNGRIKPLQIDITREIDDSFFEDVRLVIVCIDQKDSHFAKKCLKAGCHYIDISADYSYLQKVEKLHEVATEHQSTALLSVGLAPGITNVLSRWLCEQLKAVSKVEITVMLGLGDEHGQAAIEWTLHNMKQNYIRWVDGKLIDVKSFSDGKRVYFGEHYGWRTAYRFNFSDQHVLSRTLKIADVSTYLCFDSEMVTRILAWLKKLGVIYLLPTKLGVHLLRRMKIGRPMFCLKLKAEGMRQQERVTLQTMVCGVLEADITAQVTCVVAKSMYESTYPPGVYHMEQLFDWEVLFEHIQESVEWMRQV